MTTINTICVMFTKKDALRASLKVYLTYLPGIVSTSDLHNKINFKYFSIIPVRFSSKISKIVNLLDQKFKLTLNFLRIKFDRQLNRIKSSPTIGVKICLQLWTICDMIFVWKFNHLTASISLAITSILVLK